MRNESKSTPGMRVIARACETGRERAFLFHAAASVLFLSCLAISAPAFAETAEELTKIESETALLKAQAKKIEVQAQIAAKQAEIDRLSMPSAPTGPGGLILPASPVDPTIHAVEVIGKSRYATLNLGNGTMMDVKVGDVLPNGMRVYAIQPNEVVVGTGKQRIRLSHGAHAGPSHSGGGGGYSGLPSLPMPGMSAGMAPRGVPTR
jgi:type IV pilus biogenesis protein PilP